MRASASPKAPFTKRGLAERSKVWGSLRELLPPDRRWRSSPLYEEGGFFRYGGARAEQSPAPTGTSEVQRKLGGLNPLSLRKAQTAPLDAIKGSLWAAQGIVLSNFVPLPLSAITMILNVVLLIIGFITYGREFGVKTVYTSIVLPLFLGLFEKVFPDFGSMTSSQELDVLCYILVVSVGPVSYTHLEKHDICVIAGGIRPLFYIFVY